MAAAFMWGCWTGLLGIQAMCKTILCGRNGCFFCRKYMVRHELKTLWFMTKSRFLHCPTRMSISVSAKSTNSSKCLVLWFETTSMPGVAKLFDPRAEFATAWPPQGRIQWQAAVNDVALLCTFGNMVLQECVRYLMGRMWPAGRTSATATPVLCLCYNSMDMFIQNLAPPTSNAFFLCLRALRKISLWWWQYSHILQIFIFYGSWEATDARTNEPPFLLHPLVTWSHTLKLKFKTNHLICLPLDGSRYTAVSSEN